MSHVIEGKQLYRPQTSLFLALHISSILYPFAPHHVQQTHGSAATPLPSPDPPSFRCHLAALTFFVGSLLTNQLVGSLLTNRSQKKKFSTTGRPILVAQ